MLRRSTVVLAFLFILGACAQITLVTPKPQTIAGRYIVSPQVTWNRIQTQGVEIWTSDGPLLNEIRFITGVEDGAPLWSPLSGRRPPVYRHDMTPDDIVELVVSSLLNQDSLNPMNVVSATAQSLRPAPFGTLDGFQFTIDFKSKNGLDGRMIGLAAKDGERINLVLFSAPLEHYFPFYENDVRKLMESIRLKT